jgi:hypothetical protein
MEAGENCWVKVLLLGGPCTFSEEWAFEIGQWGFLGTEASAVNNWVRVNLSSAVSVPCSMTVSSGSCQSPHVSGRCGANCQRVPWCWWAGGWSWEARQMEGSVTHVRGRVARSKEWQGKSGKQDTGVLWLGCDFAFIFWQGFGFDLPFFLNKDLTFHRLSINGYRA